MVRNLPINYFVFKVNFRNYYSFLKHTPLTANGYSLENAIQKSIVIIQVFCQMKN